MIIEAYASTITAIGVMAALMLLQLTIADVIGIRRKHTPGSTVAADHDDLLFRVSRTVANTNETIAIFILAVAFCIFSEASPTYTAAAAWTYVASRAAYAICYYSNIQTLRSIVFGVAALALAALVIVGAVT